jgi:hypothetical protein
MCVVSMVGDHYAHRWDQYIAPPTFPWGPTRPEFEALKAEVAEMKELLIAAKRIDTVTGQPDCEMADKVALLRKVAEMVGVSLDDVLLPTQEGQ